MAILETKDLRKIYGSGENEVHALDGVSTVSYTHLDVYKRQDYGLTFTQTTLRGVPEHNSGTPHFSL